MGERFVYKIVNYNPPPEKGMGYGFSAILDGELVRMLRAKPMSEEARGRANELATRTIRRLWRDCDYGLDMLKEPYSFVEDSWLLHYCTVPGDRCSLSIGQSGLASIESGFDRQLDFNPHNVNHPTQAYGLLSIWLRWANAANLSVTNV